MDQPVKPLKAAPPIGPSQSAKPRPRRRLALISVLLILLAAGVWWTEAGDRAAAGRRRSERAPMSIVPETVGKGDIGINLNALGTVTSLATVTVRTQISGYLLKIDFKEGDDVKKGDLLAEIDLAARMKRHWRRQGTAGPRRSAAEGRAGRSCPLPGPGGAKCRAASDAGHAGRAGRAGPGHGRGRPRERSNPPRSTCNIAGSCRRWTVASGCVR